MSLLTSRLDASKCKSSREGFWPPRSKRPGADCNILSNQKRPKTTTTFRGCSEYILAVLAHHHTDCTRVCYCKHTVAARVGCSSNNAMKIFDVVKAQHSLVQSESSFHQHCPCCRTPTLVCKAVYSADEKTTTTIS